MKDMRVANLSIKKMHGSKNEIAYVNRRDQLLLLQDSIFYSRAKLATNNKVIQTSNKSFASTQ